MTTRTEWAYQITHDGEQELTQREKDLNTYVRTDEADARRVVKMINGGKMRAKVIYRVITTGSWTDV